MQNRPDRLIDFSGGITTATSWILRKANELEDAINARFNHRLGSVTRRLGYLQSKNTIQAAKRGLGLHESKFSTGAVTLAVTNNSGDTAAVIQSLSGSAWSPLTVSPAKDVDTKMQFWDSLGETYVAGYSPTTSTHMSILNIKNTLATSNTRNLIGAPAAKFITEYGGRLYAMNVRVGATVYSDRAYQSSPALGAITYIRGAQTLTGTTGVVIAVDTVRYLKVGMALDIYTAGTSTKIYDVTITAVDKNLNTITVAPTQNDSVSSVVAATDLLTIASTTNYPTGTPVTITAPSGFPAPLTIGTTYYVINISGTTFKLATTLANATAGTAIDITTTGSGTITVYRGFTLADNDEIWGDGRFGELAYYWNTDYPTTENSDFLKVPSGVASDTAITAFAKTNNRLMLFTKSSAVKWDQSNLTTVFEDIGCSNFDTVQNIGDWVIWLDSEGRVHARNDSTGQHDIISRAIKNNYLELIPISNYALAAAGSINNVYKLCMGSATINGITTVYRFCYDFDANNWARETHTRSMVTHMKSDMSGNMRLYFLDDTGKMFLDEEGNVDDTATATIPFFVKFGRRKQNTNADKIYTSMDIVGSNVSGAQVRATLDDSGDAVDLGQLTKNVSILQFPNSSNVHGRDINIEITQNSDGDPIEIDETCIYYSPQEERNA